MHLCTYVHVHVHVHRLCKIHVSDSLAHVTTYKYVNWQDQVRLCGCGCGCRCGVTCVREIRAAWSVQLTHIHVHTCMQGSHLSKYGFRTESSGNVNLRLNIAHHSRYVYGCFNEHAHMSFIQWMYWKLHCKPFWCLWPSNTISFSDSNVYAAYWRRRRRNYQHYISGMIGNSLVCSIFLFHCLCLLITCRRRGSQEEAPTPRGMQVSVMI